MPTAEAPTANGLFWPLHVHLPECVGGAIRAKRKSQQQPCPIPQHCAMGQQEEAKQVTGMVSGRRSGQQVVMDSGEEEDPLKEGATEVIFPKLLVTCNTTQQVM